MRLLTIGLFSLLLISIYNFWFGDSGYQTYKQTMTEISQQKSINEKQSQINQEAKAETQDLKQGFAAVEERARSNYEMVKPNETFYRILKSEK
ncbi:cell division protein FtsB [Gallibacterium anatis]|uniref:Cell division protein FtsB n=5 Tax=Gallibacterium TaxID=155493 RepID=A0A0A2XW12_9PAST|nr:MULTISPECIES: cell division protein FtsB [Gallibacterium]AEC17240.1 cell division protein FtsB [Gallibacterium anatis UMN179]ERF77532.1 cell division protein FtsB [Gallibacterium anatis 12656/12]KGQ23850.1 cell division protein FtsB [Gallibacterium anatis]KGQ24188.1 cell division protein FtsB [Gallibacterium anatis CCM5995]KGQ29329.1 cell division protein FtsB [Gallibacterium anatis]